MPKKISKNIEKKVIKLYVNQKLNSTEVSKILNISFAVVLKIVKRNGHTPRKTKDVIRGRIKEKKISYEVAINMYVNELKSASEIAKKLKCSNTTVLQILKKNNIPIRKNSFYLKKKFDEQKAIELRYKEFTIQEIAQKLNSSEYCIGEFLFKNGITQKIPSKKKLSKNIETEAIKLYKKGLSTLKISKILPISSTTVSNILKRNKIKRRNISESRTKTKYGKDQGLYDEFYLRTTGLTYDEFLNQLPKIKIYFNEVRRITNKQSIHNLENYNKRGRADGFKKDVYHLDHKYSRAEGYKNNVSPEIIGHICNLEMLPWKVNNAKQKNCSVDLETLLKQIEEYNKRELTAISN